jgi:hypothetical protein
MSKFNVYTNKTDTIFGESVTEAMAAYCKEIGENVDDYPRGPVDFTLVPDNAPITVNDDGKKVTKTAAEWVTHNMSEPRPSRLICSTEF